MMKHTEDSAKRKIAEAMAGLDVADRQRVLDRVAAQVNHVQIFETGRRELESLISETTEEHARRLKPLQEKEREYRMTVADLEARAEALEKLRPWYALQSHVLERNDCSRVHKLADALKSGRVIRADDETTVLPGERAETFVMGAQCFVVQHDWAGAFKGATDYADGEINLPFEHCTFEFRISGRTVIVVAMQPTDESLARIEHKPETRQVAIPFIECGGYWWCREHLARDDPSLVFAWQQIRAICIALDAEAATREVVRAPAALNEKRAKRGELPLRDYHVIKLSGRHVHGGSRLGGKHRSPRLHFRRGHWRHYETHKTWIRWMLVGDPELGFIDKSYRL